MDSPEVITVKAFNEAINAGDAELLASLMAPDHTFIDSGGTVVVGVEKMTEGWKDFFRMFPDYKNEFEIMFQNGSVVAAFGTASATYNGHRGLVPENRIRMPAAWKALVENGKVKLWQVYADWTGGSRVMEEDRKAVL